MWEIKLINNFICLQLPVYLCVRTMAHVLLTTHVDVRRDIKAGFVN